MEQISIDKLSPEQKRQLLEQVQAEEKEKAERIKQERQGYKKLVDEIIPSAFQKLVMLSTHILKVKQEIFDDLKTLIELKSEVFGRDIDQQTHTFTTSCGKSISVGWRLNDGWDDTVGSGLQKMNEILAEKAQSDDSKFFYDLLMEKLEVDAKGNLKAGRVMSLKKKIDAHGDPELIDAINIIVDAYSPKRTKEFITCRYRDEQGNYKDLPLDITSVEVKK